MFHENEDGGRARMCRTVFELMAVMSGEVRYEFLRSLGRAPKTVTDLMAELGLRQPCVSQNLQILRRASLVTFEQRKKDRVYRLSENIQATMDGSIMYLSSHCADSDSIIIRTHIPFVEAPVQPTFWRWATGFPYRNGHETFAFDGIRAIRAS
jgi:DNA-binding transcriptional ArsR family regulator